MNKKLVILYPNSFPLGGAATNRVMHICKILREEGNFLKLYITRPTEKKNNIQTTKKGFYEGIEFCYVNKSIVWPENFFSKVICQFVGVLKTSNILVKEKYDIVLSYGDYSFFNHFIYFLIVKARQKKIVYAVDEFPWSIIFKTNSIFNILYIRFFYKLFDALFVMTFTLMDYYSNKIRKDSKMYHLPMTVEIDRFNVKVTDDNKGSTYIAYCGYDIYINRGSVISKDGVDILIDAFALISNKHPNIFLYIIGESNEYRYKQVEKLNLKEKVIFTGSIPQNDLPKYLCNANLLALARPNSIQAQGAFPSKLGEYLATGIPVIVTKVGEIPLYLKDNWNAFLAEPGDVKSFAEKMDYALSNPDIAKEVGIRGRELAKKEFDYKIHGIRLQNFLNKI
jgi:glycosyltransferase involved in cell wall biosynthesis